MNNTTQAFYAIVNSKSLKTDILFVVEQKNRRKRKNNATYNIMNQHQKNALEVLENYHYRFQMEFNFRDVKTNNRFKSLPSLRFR